MSVLLRLTVNETKARAAYDGYVGDVAWYRENNKLDPDTPDDGYRTGDPGTYEKWLDEWIDSIVEDIGESEGGIGYWRVEREPTA